MPARCKISNLHKFTSFLWKHQIDIIWPFWYESTSLAVPGARSHRQQQLQNGVSINFHKISFLIKGKKENNEVNSSHYWHCQLSAWILTDSYTDYSSRYCCDYEKEYNWVKNMLRFNLCSIYDYKIHWLCEIERLQIQMLENIWGLITLRWVEILCHCSPSCWKLQKDVGWDFFLWMLGERASWKASSEFPQFSSDKQTGARFHGEQLLEVPPGYLSYL